MRFITNSTHPVFGAAKLAAAAVLALALSYFALEPTLSHSQDSDEFLVQQSITPEISFIAEADDITMSPSIPGQTGGFSSGTTSVRVLTNDTAGFTMTMHFSDDVAMQGDTTTGEIPNYIPDAVGTADFGWQAPPANTAEFGYTVGASTTDDLALRFKNDGSSTCGTDGTNTNFSCFFNPTSSVPNATTLINRDSETPSSGATSSIAFRVQVQNNPSPAIPEDLYTATATLTATTN